MTSDGERGSSTLLGVVAAAVLLFLVFDILTALRADGATTTSTCRSIVHRGVHNAAVDEETAASVTSLRAGDRAELDVRVTADHRFVMMHDDTVDRTTDGHGPIEDMTLSEALELRTAHGSAPLDLDTALALRRPLLLEVKRYAQRWTEADVAALADQVEGRRVWVTGTRAVLKLLKPTSVRTYWLLRDRRHPPTVAEATARGVDLVIPFRRVATPAEITDLRAAGFALASSAATRGQLRAQVARGYRVFWTDRPNQVREWCR